MIRKGDVIWLGILLVWILIIIIPTSRVAFLSFTSNHSYIGSFIKFSILATMGDFIGFRIANGYYKKPIGMIYKAIVWGLIGMAINLMIVVYKNGVQGAQLEGLLPFQESVLLSAFLISATMHITFSSIVFLFHRISDTFIETYYIREDCSLKSLISKIDWNNFVSFTLLKTIPLFWIPCHTLVFILPDEYRVLASAGLSIALGLLLGISKTKKPIKTI